MGEYYRRAKAVDAIQWTGDNRDQVTEFMNCFYDLDAIKLRFTRDEDPARPGTDPREDPGNMVLFDLYDNEGREYVEPSQWIVVEKDPYAEDDHPYDYSVQVMCAVAFAFQHEPEPEPRIAGRLAGSTLTPATADDPWWRRVWAVMAGAGIRL